MRQLLIHLLRDPARPRSYHGRLNEQVARQRAARFVIEPGRRVDSDDSGQCRQFALTRTASDGAQRVYPGVACRNATGRWQVLGLDDKSRLVKLATP